MNIDNLGNGLDVNLGGAQGRNRHLTQRSNAFDQKSQMSKVEFERQVTALTNTMNNPDLVKSLKDVYGISWENKKMIYLIEKKFTKMMADMLNEYEQVKRREELFIQEKIRQEMYD